MTAFVIFKPASFLKITLKLLIFQRKMAKYTTFFFLYGVIQ